MKPILAMAARVAALNRIIAQHFRIRSTRPISPHPPALHWSKPLAHKARQPRCNDSRNRRPVATPSRREQRRTMDKLANSIHCDKRTIDKRRLARDAAGSAAMSFLTASSLVA